MNNENKKYSNIDEYIESFPAPVQLKLEEIRNIIKTEVPEAVEKISYQMPTFYLKKNLVHFAAFKKHIGLYPTPGGLEAYKDEILKYKHGKGSLQFPLSEPLPVDLIKRIIHYRVNELKED